MIELVISVAMATFVVFGLYGIFTMQSRQLMNQELRMEMHQNGRFALEILSRSIRMAGFGSQCRYRCKVAVAQAPASFASR